MLPTVLSQACVIRDTYQFIDSYPSLCLDKKDLILAQLEACERLLEYAVDEDKNTVESEIRGYRD
jgi:hypothetical protein